MLVTLCARRVMPGVMPLRLQVGVNTMRVAVTLLAGFILISCLGACGTQEPQVRPRADNPTPSKSAALVVSKLDDPNIKERIIRGEKIYRTMQKQFPIENPQVRGHMTRVPTLGLFITNQMWDSLTTEQKIDYTWYAESLIPKIKSSPHNYAGVPSSAPLFYDFVEKTRNLCSDCWQIIVGDPVREPRIGSMAEVEKVSITVDKVVAQGATPWQADNPCCRGIKVSEFRR
jgi:hypothetical protein